MRVLLLASKACSKEMISALEIMGDTVVFNPEQKADFVVCYGYRNILKKPFLDQYKNRVVNIHPSLLPWNRGAHPNFWSWFDDTPKGTSIHYVDEGIDTGQIIAQQSAEFTGDETLESSYMALHDMSVALFKKHWPAIRDNGVVVTFGGKGGSFHKTHDIEPYWERLPHGWKTKVKFVSEMGRVHRNEQEGRRSWLANLNF